MLDRINTQLTLPPASSDLLRGSNLFLRAEPVMDPTAGDDSSLSCFGSILDGIRSDREDVRVESAKEIRRLTKSSSRSRRLLSGAVEPLVKMLNSESEESNEAAILALLNLAVKDESNKIKIVDAGALGPLIAFLQSPNSNLQEYATVALLTLSACPGIKPVIVSTSAIPLLVEVLRDGSPQAKADAITTLSNLSATPNALCTILSSHPIPALINLLKTSKKSSKTTEKCVALLESLMALNEAQEALTSEPGGVLSVVVALEDGSSRTREHAVGTLLTLCQSDRCKYREVILNEGVIPGLLELTVQGTDRARPKARELLVLLRDPRNRRSELEGETLENIVSDIVCSIGAEDTSGKAKRMLAEMVKVSMEQSLRHLERRASLVCTPAAELAALK